MKFLYKIVLFIITIVLYYLLGSFANQENIPWIYFGYILTWLISSIVDLYFIERKPKSTVIKELWDYGKSNSWIFSPIIYIFTKLIEILIRNNFKLNLAIITSNFSVEDFKISVIVLIIISFLVFLIEKILTCLNKQK